jgi:hypothetical protein
MSRTMIQALYEDYTGGMSEIQTNILIFDTHPMPARADSS